MVDVYSTPLVISSSTDAISASLRAHYARLAIDTAMKRRPKYTRSKTGCLTCRQKKVKCDEQKPACSRCCTAKRDCDWPAVSTASSSRKRRSSLPTPSLSSAPSTPPEMEAESPQSGQLMFSGGPTLLPSPVKIPTSICLRIDGQHQSAAYLPPSPVSSSSPSDHTSVLSRCSTLVSSPSTASAVTTADSMFLPRRSTIDYQTSPVSSAPPVVIVMPQSQPPVDLAVHVPYGAHNYANRREQQLVEHFLKITTSHLMSNSPLDGTNPMLALINDCSPNVESLNAQRFAMASIAAIHNAHMHKTTGGSFELELNEIEVLRQTGHNLLAAALSRGLCDETALASAVTLLFSDMLWSNSGAWSEHISIAREVVTGMGGVDVLLSAIPAPTASPWTMPLVLSSSRFCLEMLVVLETFGGLTTGEEPALLGEGSMMWHYLQEGSDARLRDLSFHAQSIETVFGFSRSLILLVKKVSSILSKAAAYPGQLFEHQTPGLDAPDVLHKLDANVRMVLFELNNWQPPLFTGQERVKQGNDAFTLALQIILLRSVYGVHHTDSRVQAAAAMIIDIASNCAALRQSAHMLFPLAIASCELTPAHREHALSVLSQFRYTYCFLFDKILLVIQQVWQRLDSQHPLPFMRSVLEELGYRLLLL